MPTTTPGPIQTRTRSIPQGVFVGANDGASGVALLMQLGETVKDLDGKYGVDFVLFDGEEFVFATATPIFSARPHFADDYVARPPGHTYRPAWCSTWWGIRNLEIYQEGNSLDWPASRSVVNSLWATAKRWACASSCRGSARQSTTIICRLSARPRFRRATSSTSTIPTGTRGATRPTNARLEPGESRLGDERVA